MLERAKAATRYGRYAAVEYARFADDLVILVDAHPRHAWLRRAVQCDCGRNWPNCRSRSTKRRAQLSTWPRRKLRLPGVRVPSCARRRRCMAAALHAQAQEANGDVGQAPGHLPPLPIPTGGSGHELDQPDPAGLGELLRGGSLQSVLQLRPRLGGKEDQAAHDASPETPGLRLEEVE